MDIEIRQSVTKTAEGYVAGEVVASIDGRGVPVGEAVAALMRCQRDLTLGRVGGELLGDVELLNRVFDYMKECESRLFSHSSVYSHLSGLPLTEAERVRLGKGLMGLIKRLEGVANQPGVPNVHCGLPAARLAEVITRAQSDLASADDSSVILGVNQDLAKVVEEMGGKPVVGNGVGDE